MLPKERERGGEGEGGREESKKEEKGNNKERNKGKEEQGNNIPTSHATRAHMHNSA